jgi:hypothetical protein
VTVCKAGVLILIREFLVDGLPADPDVVLGIVEFEMGPHGLMAALFVSLIAIALGTANAKKSPDRGDPGAGRDLALEAAPVVTSSPMISRLRLF